MNRPGRVRPFVRCRFLAALLLTAVLSAGPGPGLGLGPEPALAGDSLKGTVRSWFGLLSQSAAEPAPGPFPAGAALVSWPGGRGVRLDPGRFRIQPIVWTGSHGLLAELGQRGGTPAAGPLGAINGAFYSTQGVLGQVVIDGALPRQPRQLPGSLSRCFVAVVAGPDGHRWVLGETAARGQDLLAPDFLAGARVNRPLRPGDRLEHLLGGGGWIVREGKDVHMEAYGRQRFRFRQVDQDSRHTVLAMDRDDRLYLLVFETGANLAAVSAALRDPSRFPGGITEAVFLDGGSSSVLVWGGRNLVAPLYLVDKARFSALAVWPAAP